MFCVCFCLFICHRMNTAKPISTISFNTPEFLKLALDDLIDAGILSFYAYIVHKPEDDEGGTKQHIHLYAEPSKRMQTDNLKEHLAEFDPDKPDKPKGCISWISSKFDHWYLYALHDKRYLAMKGQSRHFHYSHEEIQTSDVDDLNFKVRMIDMLALSPYSAMQDAQKNGVTWQEFFARGTVPINQVVLYEKAWNLLSQVSTDRNGREGHPNGFYTDPQTGEVFYY